MSKFTNSLEAARRFSLPFEKMYKRFFYIHEFETDHVLQWSYGASLFFFFASFSAWINSHLITVETAQRGLAVCWPYFQNCWKLYFLHALPDGYSQTVLYMGFYALMLLAVYCMWKRQWVYAHAILLILFLWKVFVLFFLSYLMSAPYDYYHIILTAILLFIPFRLYFLKIAFVFLYFLSGTIKIDSTWILGTYFTSLKTGLPLFPDFVAPILTNFVIFMQIVGAWFLLSKNWVLQRLALSFFVFFHLYSGIFVLYHYPSISLAPLLILFGPMYRYTPLPISRKALWGWGLIGMVILFQIPGFFISLPGDRRLSLEGNRYGMFMFEANHQCIMNVKTYTKTDLAIATTDIDIPTGTCGFGACPVRIKTYEEDGLAVNETRFESASAWNRCDPYMYWVRYTNKCKSDPSVDHITLTFDHSINGGPFYRIIDAPDICGLSYSPFSHNDWINVTNPPIVGFPVKNVYSY